MRYWRVAAALIPFIPLASATAALAQDEVMPEETVSGQGVGSLFDAFYHSTGISQLGAGHVVMLCVGVLLVYLGARRNIAPWFLAPAGIAAILANIPATGIAEPGGFLYYLYFFGVHTGMLPMLLFLSLGAMLDFGALAVNPRMFFIGAAVQLGIAAAFAATISLGHFSGALVYDLRESASIALLAGADGPLAVFVSSKLADHMTDAVALAAYLVMGFAAVLHPWLLHRLLNRAEAGKEMAVSPVPSLRIRIAFPIIVAFAGALFVPPAGPLLGMLALGSILKDLGMLNVTARQNLFHAATILLGLAVGSRLDSDYVPATALLVLVLVGTIAMIVATIAGIFAAKLLSLLKPLNPMVGAAGVPALNTSARAVEKLGLEEQHLLTLRPYAEAANAAGTVAMVVVAGVLLSLL